jgi:23S rRNA pseudouridine2605 synthase
MELGRARHPRAGLASGTPEPAALGAPAPRRDADNRDGRPAPAQRAAGVRPSAPQHGRRRGPAGRCVATPLRGRPVAAGAAPRTTAADAPRQAAESQPDPMKTAFGYIGADSFTRQRQGSGVGSAGGSAPGGGGGRRRRRAADAAAAAAGARRTQG